MAICGVTGTRLQPQPIPLPFLVLSFHLRQVGESIGACDSLDVVFLLVYDGDEFAVGARGQAEPLSRSLIPLKLELLHILTDRIGHGIRIVAATDGERLGSGIILSKFAWTLVVKLVFIR